VITVTTLSPAEARAPGALDAALALRHEVFVDEQGVPPELEVDGEDPACVHVLATVDGLLVGTARLREVDGHAKAERVAVRATARRQGVGRALMAALEQEAARTHTWLHLHAQDTAIPFYLDLGYVVDGAPFTEAGIVHVAMRRRVWSP
jgi:predicted GNAT family N-acyltransferase